MLHEHQLPSSVIDRSPLRLALRPLARSARRLLPAMCNMLLPPTKKSRITQEVTAVSHRLGMTTPL